MLGHPPRRRAVAASYLHDRSTLATLPLGYLNRMGFTGSLQCRIVADPQKSRAVFGVDKRVRLTPLYLNLRVIAQKKKPKAFSCGSTASNISVECGKGRNSNRTLGVQCGSPLLPPAASAYPLNRCDLINFLFTITEQQVDRNSKSLAGNARTAPLLSSAPAPPKPAFAP